MNNMHTVHSDQHSLTTDSGGLQNCHIQIPITTTELRVSIAHCSNHCDSCHQTTASTSLLIRWQNEFLLRQFCNDERLLSHRVSFTVLIETFD